MATVGSQVVVRKYDGFGGSFLDSDMLANSYDTGKPHVFQNTLGKLFAASDRFSMKPLLGLTLGKKKVQEIDSEIYRWWMQGAEYKSLRVLENLEVGNPTPGINNTPFRLKLDEDWVHYPDVLFGENNEYPLAIVHESNGGGPIPDGTGFIYLVKIQNDDPNAFFPPDLLEEGKEFCKVWNSVPSEYNEDGSGLQFPSSFQLECQVSAFEKHWTVTDKAWREGGMLEVPFRIDGKMVTKFIPQAEAMLEDDLHMDMEAQLMYGKKSTSAGPKGYWTKTGPGLRQQMADGWIEYYNGALTEQRLRDYLMDIFFSRVNESDRKVVMMTGTMGSMMFHDLLASAASGFLTVDTHFISGKDNMDLTFGAQFRHYKGPEGIEVTVVKNPLYDSLQYCKQTHPDFPDKPVDSYRFTFMDFGKSNGEDNIQFLRVKNTYRHGYVPGSYTPTGPVKGGATSSLVAGYTHFTGGTAGIWIKDVTRTGELILSVD